MPSRRYLVRESRNNSRISSQKQQAAVHLVAPTAAKAHEFATFAFAETSHLESIDITSDLNAIIMTTPASYLLSIVFFAISSVAQDFSAEERLQGYAMRDQQAVFVYDNTVYGAPSLSRVVVTGAFRGWSQDMSDPGWQLGQDDT
ncbi:MAG: hypothetical protein R3178_02010, partial [Rhodothermales bacterium]|nr:hypothetical protein [Rhodothermales bacterium]